MDDNHRRSPDVFTDYDDLPDISDETILNLIENGLDSSIERKEEVKSNPILNTNEEVTNHSTTTRDSSSTVNATISTGGSQTSSKWITSDEETREDTTYKIPRLLLADIFRAEFNTKTKQFILDGDYVFKQVAILGEIAGIEEKYFELNDFTYSIRIYADRANIGKQLHCLKKCDVSAPTKEEAMTNDAIGLTSHLVRGITRLKRCLSFDDFKIWDVVYVVGNVTYYKGFVSIFAKSVYKVEKKCVGRELLRWLLERKRLDRDGTSIFNADRDCEL